MIRDTRICMACMMIATAAMVAIVIPGCGNSGPPDERLAEFALQSMDTQSRQNEQMAGQTREVAIAAKRLVELDGEARRELIQADADSRREMIEAQSSLQEGLQRERSSLDRQREDLEGERQHLDEKRRSIPVMTEVVRFAATLIASLCPLALAAYVLVTMNRRIDGPDVQAVNELLVTELVSARPRILQHPEVRRIDTRPLPPDDDSPSDSDADSGDPPF